MTQCWSERDWSLFVLFRWVHRSDRRHWFSPHPFLPPGRPCTKCITQLDCLRIGDCVFPAKWVIIRMQLLSHADLCLKKRSSCSCMQSVHSGRSVPYIWEFPCLAVWCKDGHPLSRLGLLIWHTVYEQWHIVLHSLSIYDSVHHLFALFNTAKDKAMELGLLLCPCKIHHRGGFLAVDVKLNRTKRDFKIGSPVVRLVDFLDGNFWVIFHIVHCDGPGQNAWKHSLRYKSTVGLCVCMCVPITVHIKRNNSGGVGRRKVSRRSCSVINGVISPAPIHVRTHMRTRTNTRPTCKHTFWARANTQGPINGLWMGESRIQMRHADNCTKNTECWVAGQQDFILSSACLFSQLSYFCRDLNHGIKTLQCRSIFYWVLPPLPFPPSPHRNPPHTGLIPF